MSAVCVNGAWLVEQLRQQVESLCGTRLLPGRYWYDPRSGLAGAEGQGASAILPAGLNLGEVAPDASNGTSGVFLNDRQLTFAEVAYLERLVGAAIWRGRYWLDSQGNAGREGGPPLVNLYQLARSGNNRWSNGDGTWTWSNPATGNSASGDGNGNVAVFGPNGLIHSQGD